MSRATNKVSVPPPVAPLNYEPRPAAAGARQSLFNILQAGARVAALAIIFVSFGLVVGPSFFRAGNVENILRQSAVFAMAGLGMTMVIITAGIDLAAGSLVALSMVVTAMILAAGGSRTGYLASYPFLWTMIAVIGGALAATIVGVTQGMLITGLNLVPFIVTLGGMQAIRGLTKGIAGNQEISPPANWLSKHLMFPVQGRVFNWQLVPVGVWATLLAALLAGALLRYTKLGRHIYAVGSNEATARLCGVSVSRTKIIVYALAGLFAGLAGVLEYSKLNLGQPTGAVSYELYVIAACVIGGSSLMGGVGTITGTVIGALMIGTLNIGAQQAEWPKWLQEIAIGVIIVAAAALDQLRARVRS